MCADQEERHVAVLRAIDKKSARRSTFDVPVDKTIQFGEGLFIKVRACRAAAPPSSAPDAIAGLTLWLKADAITGLSDGAAVTSRG